jgi:hypothetical protein
MPHRIVSEIKPDDSHQAEANDAVRVMIESVGYEIHRASFRISLDENRPALGGQRISGNKKAAENFPRLDENL